MRALLATLLCLFALVIGAPRASAQDAAQQPATTQLQPIPPATEPAPVTAPAAQPQPIAEPQQQLEPIPAPAPPQPVEAPEPPPVATVDEPAPVAELMTVELNAGLGVGTRSYERPYGAQLQELETTPFTALDLSLRVKRCTSDCAVTHYAIEFLLRYQTSLGMRVEQPLLFALPSEVDARSSRLELSLAPIFRLGASKESVSIAVPIGASVRALQAPHRDLPLPSYLLFGPHLRPEARVALGDTFALRGGPELQWIAMIGDRLQHDGVGGSGVALGFELAASATLTSWLGLELTYRQAHAFASGDAGRADFEDVERYATLQLSGRQ